MLSWPAVAAAPPAPANRTAVSSSSSAEAPSGPWSASRSRTAAVPTAAAAAVAAVAAADLAMAGQAVRMRVRWKLCCSTCWSPSSQAGGQPAAQALAHSAHRSAAPLPQHTSRQPLVAPCASNGCLQMRPAAHMQRAPVRRPAAAAMMQWQAPPAVSGSCLHWILASSQNWWCAPSRTSRCRTW